MMMASNTAQPNAVYTHVFLLRQFSSLGGETGCAEGRIGADSELLD